MTRRPRYALLSAAIAALSLGAAALAGAPPAAASPARGAAPSAAPAFSGRLYSVAATSASDVWGVGLNGNGSLIVHYNGTSWTQTAFNDHHYLLGVAAISPTDAWAVGGSNWFSPVSTLIYHWDGTSWTQLSSPNQLHGGYLNGVAATSASDVWAVGLTSQGGPGVGTEAGDRTLIDHYNGTSWARVPSPSLDSIAVLNGVSADSPTDAWAVGWDGNGSSKECGLIEHWNGTSWSVVPNASPNGFRSYLDSVVAISPTDAWAVGQTHLGSNVQPLVEHWDGTSWTQVTVPIPTPGGTLAGVAAYSASDVWAVGTIVGNRGVCPTSGCQTVTEHWNGTAWSLVPSPNPPSQYLNALFSVVPISPTDAWAVGTTDYASTLILQWNGTTWQ
jgi:hypothetical protein